jgi:hypothetical protein
VEIIGFLSCGGCSGKKAVTRAKMMVSEGQRRSCLPHVAKNGNPIGYLASFLPPSRVRLGESRSRDQDYRRDPLSPARTKPIARNNVASLAFSFGFLLFVVPTKANMKIEGKRWVRVWQLS